MDIVLKLIVLSLIFGTCFVIGKKIVTKIKKK